MTHRRAQETDNAPETSTCGKSGSHRRAGGQDRREDRGGRQGRHTRPRASRQNRRRGRGRHARTAGSPPPNLIPDSVAVLGAPTGLEGMQLVPGGEFAMGSADFYPEEAPVRPVEVDGFWIDERPVTVGQFRRFVKQTEYVTVAERPLDPELFPDADPATLVLGHSSSGRRAGRWTCPTSGTGG